MHMRRAAIVLGVGLALAAAWWLTPLGDILDGRALLDRAQAVRATGAAAVLVPVLFVALSLLLVPIVVLRVTTVLVFGPILGPLYAIAGVAAAAWVGHLLGERAGAGAVDRIGGPRVRAIRERLAKSGVLAIAAARLVPLGPFTLVNAVGGAARIPRGRFVLGTVIGMTPGLVLLALFGGQLEALLG
jgi:phospholipase D1/2